MLETAVEMLVSRLLFCVSIRAPCILLDDEVFKEEGFISSLNCSRFGGCGP